MGALESTEQSLGKESLRYSPLPACYKARKYFLDKGQTFVTCLCDTQCTVTVLKLITVISRTVNSLFENFLSIQNEQLLWFPVAQVKSEPGLILMQRAEEDQKKAWHTSAFMEKLCEVDSFQVWGHFGGILLQVTDFHLHCTFTHTHYSQTRTRGAEWIQRFPFAHFKLCIKQHSPISATALCAPIIDKISSQTPSLSQSAMTWCRDHWGDTPRNLHPESHAEFSAFNNGKFKYCRKYWEKTSTLLLQKGKKTFRCKLALCTFELEYPHLQIHPPSSPSFSGD